MHQQLARTLPSDVYVRLNPVLEDISLISSIVESHKEKLDLMLHRTREYLRLPHIRREMERAALLLTDTASYSRIHFL